MYKYTHTANLRSNCDQTIQLQVRKEDNLWIAETGAKYNEEGKILPHYINPFYVQLDTATVERLDGPDSK